MGEEYVRVGLGRDEGGGCSRDVKCINYMKKKISLGKHISNWDVSVNPLPSKNPQRKRKAWKIQRRWKTPGKQYILNQLSKALIDSQGLKQ